MRMNRLTLASIVISGGLLMSSCGGGSSSSTTSTPVVASDTTVTINATTGPASIASVMNVPATFPNGIAALGTTKSTTLTIKGTAAAPTFELTTADGTSKGNLSFGSCIFTFTSVTAVSPFPAGATVTINPCSVTLGTKGQSASGLAQSGGLVFNFGVGQISNPFTVPYTISSNGTITINGSTFGTGTLTTGS